jgi:hypothetical protein
MRCVAIHSWRLCCRLVLLVAGLLLLLLLLLLCALLLLELLLALDVPEHPSEGRKVLGKSNAPLQWRKQDRQTDRRACQLQAHV